MTSGSFESQIRAVLPFVVRATFSGPLDKRKTPIEKITVKSISIKNTPYFQLSIFKGNQVFHENLAEKAFIEKVVNELVPAYKQALLRTETEEFQILNNKKQKPAFLKKAGEKLALSKEHDRKKHYILEEGQKIPFLVRLGVMSTEGRVLAKKSDKFKQLNRFLEMIRDVVPHLDRSKKLQIIDFGCGKAYLTFAVYHYLHHILGYEVQILGLDLKKEVVEYCQSVADELKFEGLKFSVGDINHYIPDHAVDMVITLHACDTATDAAIEKAVNWNAKVILSVPCCQHELFNQVQSKALSPLLKHGVLKERFSALVTDAARAQVLEMIVYTTTVMEFIDLEHTPKNLLIRAVKRDKILNKEKLSEEYHLFKATLGIHPSLEGRLL